MKSKRKTSAIASATAGTFTTKLDPFEFRVFRRFGEALEGERILIACSGGRDSVALVEVFSRIQSRIPFELSVAYVHHGMSENTKTTRYRNSAARAVEKLAAARSLSFQLLKVDSLRELRS